jgi:hypothetical protein
LITFPTFCKCAQQFLAHCVDDDDFLGDYAFMLLMICSTTGSYLMVVVRSVYHGLLPLRVASAAQRKKT